VIPTPAKGGHRAAPMAGTLRASRVYQAPEAWLESPDISTLCATRHFYFGLTRFELVQYSLDSRRRPLGVPAAIEGEGEVRAP
jgi:hypothetical protein